VTPQGEMAIARYLFNLMRGKNHLIFPNSRNGVEKYADLLRNLAEDAGMQNEFWPHHGSLSKDIREDTERALKNKERPATAIATSTLEMGIDIGSVESVAQIGPPPSVASLRQRLGRSGRRKGESAILRAFCIEGDMSAQSPISDQLREGLLQSIAMIELLIRGWFEPPRAEGMHLSTLIQQLLSAIGQFGGITAGQAWQLLCEHGPFKGISKPEFASLLRALGAQKILVQDHGGALLAGEAGEAITSHYSFYAAFNSAEEYRVQHRGKSLGTLPMTHPIGPNDLILLAGNRWRVKFIDSKAKTIEVERAKGGKAPSFGGSGGQVHTQVRQEMKRLLEDSRHIPYLDPAAADFLQSARQAFKAFGLSKRDRLVGGDKVTLFLWLGDDVQTTLAMLLKYKGINAQSEGLCVRVEDADEFALNAAIRALAEHPDVTPEELLKDAEGLGLQKYDVLLPSPLKEKNYASLNLALPEAYAWIRTAARGPASTETDE